MANTFPHEDLIQEEQINYEDLPSEITDEIEEFDELKKEYNEFPSEKGYKILVQESIQIADSIQDWLEINLEEEEIAEQQELQEVREQRQQQEQPNIENKQEEQNSKPSWRFWM